MTQQTELYDYPNDSFSRVEGKNLFQLEKEIMEDGPFPESRISRIHILSEDKTHPLHYVAMYYLYLKHEIAKGWELEPGQEIPKLPDEFIPRARTRTTT